MPERQLTRDMKDGPVTQWACVCDMCDAPRPPTRVKPAGLQRLCGCKGLVRMSKRHSDYGSPAWDDAAIARLLMHAFVRKLQPKAPDRAACPHLVDSLMTYLPGRLLQVSMTPAGTSARIWGSQRTQAKAASRPRWLLMPCGMVQEQTAPSPSGEAHKRIPLPTTSKRGGP